MNDNLMDNLSIISFCQSLPVSAAAAAKSLQLCPNLCDPIDGSPAGSSVPGMLQARTLEWVAIYFSNACMHAKSLQSWQTLCDPVDSSPPGSSVQRILQARVLEWVAISFSIVMSYQAAKKLSYFLPVPTGGNLLLGMSVPQHTQPVQHTFSVGPEKNRRQINAED